MPIRLVRDGDLPRQVNDDRDRQDGQQEQLKQQHVKAVTNDVPCPR
jgi:hypothetical protein